MKVICLLLPIALIFFFPRLVLAQVVINEILPNPVEGSNEWVELYNLGSEEASISGWLLVDKAGTPKSLDSLVISGSGFVVYEYPSGDGWLNNSTGDTLSLQNDTGETIDSFTYEKDPGEGKSFGRSPNGLGGWVVFDEPTKAGVNPDLPPTPTLSPTPTPSPTPTLTNTPTPTHTPTPKPTSTPRTTVTPTPKISPTITPTVTPSLGDSISTVAGEILGEEAGSSAFYPLAKAEEAPEGTKESQKQSKNLLPFILSGAGLIILFLVSLGAWYTFNKKSRNEKL